jgi:Fic family protein
VDRLDGTVIHSPPPAGQLPERLQALCKFANEDENESRFIHPVVRAILLHFWLAYDHPFEDGNGRTARALFYWYMRTRGYWLVEYLSISRILRHAPSKYSRAFLLTETDERDATYFVINQLEVIQRAVEELHEYLQLKIRDVRDVELLLRGSSTFNHRQLALLGNALRSPDGAYSFQGHAASHGVTHETARNDLLALSRLGFLNQQRRGRRFVFTAPSDLAERLEVAH